MQEKYYLVISCPDQSGIVAAVSGFIAQHRGFILEANHHTDLKAAWFFMRYEIDAETLDIDIQQFSNTFQPIAEKFQMTYRIASSHKKPNVLLMVSRTSHCLEEILYRWSNQELHCNIMGVFSNHDLLSERIAYFKLPFYFVPIEKDNKSAHFNALEKIIQQNGVDTVVLARYMQILPQHLCSALQGRAINIHHSFLPSFIGANPYAQAHQRGVKLIGATAHYVTSDLDEGPIIEQNVIRVSHRENLEDFIRLGKNVERSVLADALQAHLEYRVIIHNNKTIVFN